MIFNWILVDKLAIGTPLLSEKDKLFLKEKKIISILDLRNQFDLEGIDHNKQLCLYKDFNLINVKLPDHKSGRLAETLEIRQAVDLLHSLLSKGPVFIHCHASVERSPLISIAYLHLKKGFSIIQCCDFVKQQHKPTVVNLDQLKYIK